MRTKYTMKKHYVTFYSPGTFVSEQTTKEINDWDVNKAIEMAQNIIQRYSATPYGFQFITKARSAKDLDSKIVDKSPMYYLGGTVRSLEQVEADNLPEENILRSNMRSNNIKRIITNNNSWRHTAALDDDAIVLNFTPKHQEVA